MNKKLENIAIRTWYGFMMGVLPFGVFTMFITVQLIQNNIIPYEDSPANAHMYVGIPIIIMSVIGFVIGFTIIHNRLQRNINNE